jgi:PIN domain nuclease of toxin-antitoxin system
MAPLVVHLDTHVVAWLYAGRADLLGGKARRRIEQSDPFVSPIVVLELEYLFESGRTSEHAARVMDDLAARIGLRVSDTAFATVVEHARLESWTRDPFDRLIVGHARADGASLVTKDRTIQAHYRQTVWE